MSVDQSLYEQDFYTWATDQAGVLACHQVEFLDWEHLAEELAELGNRHSSTGFLFHLLSTLGCILYSPDSSAILFTLSTASKATLALN